MALFNKRQDILPRQTGKALGATSIFEIPKTWYLEGLFLKATFNVAAAAATLSADGLFNIIKRVRLTVADGGATREIVSASGLALHQWQMQTNGTCDPTFINFLGQNTTGDKTMYFPIPLVPNQLPDPVRSLFLVPAPRFASNPQLEVEIGGQADIDVNASPTFALSAAKVSLEVVVVMRNIRGELRTLDWELHEYSQSYAANQEVRWEFPSPGFYTGALLRPYTSTSARGDISQSSGSHPDILKEPWSIHVAGQYPRRFRLEEAAIENIMSMYATPISVATAVASNGVMIDFLSDGPGRTVLEMNSLLDVNAAKPAGAVTELVGRVTGGAGVKLNILAHRVIGDPAKAIAQLKA